MNKKIIIKLSLLIVGLVVFFYFKKSLDSFSQTPAAKAPLAAVFNDLKSFQWCSEVQGQLNFKRGNHLLHFAKFTDAEVKKQFCTVDMESFTGIDVKKITDWETLATAVDSGGGQVKLEWNAEHRLFKADGLPFRSKKLTQKLSL